MADAISIQELIDARTDAKSLEEVVNGNESKQVTTRKGETYPSVKKALTQMFENGGLPATPFATKALMTASVLVDGDYAMVTDDTVNNGLYVKEAGAWVKSGYDPLGMARKDIETVNKSIYGIVEPTWELGSIGGASGVKLNGPSYENRARISNLKALAPNTTVKVESSDPELGVLLVTWDKDGGYSQHSSVYARKAERKVPYHYNVIVKYNDERFFDVNTIKDLVTVTFSTASDLVASELAEYKIVNSDNINRITNTLENRPIAAKWINGFISISGNPWNSNPTIVATRLRSDPFKIALTGDLVVTLNDPDKKVIVNLFDQNGELVKWNTVWYTTKWEGKVDGYYSILLAWDDDRPIQPSDALGVVVEHSYPVNPKISESISFLENLILTREFKASWEVGSIDGWGDLWDKPSRDRLRISTEKTRLDGILEVESLDPLMSVNIVEYDSQGVFIKYGSFVPKDKKEINGYFNILVRWNDDREITADDAQVKITLNQTAQSTNESGVGESNWFEQTPQFSSVPFGHLLNRPLVELQTAFDGLVSQYPYQTKKEVFGRTGDDLYDMHAYTLEPPYPEACIAITMHTHGNERWNPLGFFALLDLFGKNTPQHSLITWLRDRVKWYVVPFMSPRAVVDNTRATRGINLNRNFDFLFNETADSGKGSAPYSLPEAQNIYDFFVVRKDEIMFHLDLHDIPQVGGDVYSHNPAHHNQFVWLKEQKQMQKHLADINNGRGDTDYPFENGSVLSLFLGVFAIPSVTPEHITQWWINRGLKPDQEIAKALEQTCGFLYLFKHMLDNKDTRNSAFYTRDLEVPFASLASGHISWSKQQVKDAFNEVGFLQEINSDGVFVNEGSNTNKSILLITGMYDDDNNSDLTALRVVEQINSSESVFVNLLKDCKLIVAPAISDGLTEGEVNSRITNLINKYQPKYTVLVEAPKLAAPSNLTRVETSDSTYLTSKTKEAGYGVYVEQNGYAENLSTRYTHFNLANEVAKHAIYPHTVANWVGLVLNDLASYYAEI